MNFADLTFSPGNSQGDCLPTPDNMIQSIGLDTINAYVGFTSVVFLSAIGLCFVILVFSMLYERYKNMKRNERTRKSQGEIRSEKAFAFNTIGSDSVYQFFLTKSWRGWIIAMATMGIQCWVLGIFVKGAERDLQDDASDLMYTFLCPRDQVTCENRADLTKQGWAAFGILMAVHLSKDLINGMKLVSLAASEGHYFHRQVRFFLSGMLLTTVTSFTLYSSAIYNKAIATSDTEVIANS